MPGSQVLKKLYGNIYTLLSYHRKSGDSGKGGASFSETGGDNVAAERNKNGNGIRA
jgi:hypothetical protein